MRAQFFAGQVTEVQTAQSYAPGELVYTKDKTYGTRTWRYIKNGDIISIGIGTIVQRKAATNDNMTGIVCVTIAKRRGMLLGASQSVIPAGSFGFILKEGLGLIKPEAAAVLTAADLVKASGEAAIGGGKTADPTVLAEVLGVVAECITTSAAGVATLCNCYFP